MSVRNARHTTTLLIGLQILLALSIVVGVLLNVFSLRQETLNRHLKDAEAQARVFEDQLTQTLNLSNLTLQSLPESIDLATMHGAQKKPGAANSQLEIIQRRLLFLRSLSVANAQDEIIASSNPENIGKKINTDDFAPRQDEPNPASFLRIGPPWAGRDFATGQPASAAQPVAADSSSFIPVVRAAVMNQQPVKLLAAINPDYFLNHFTRNIDPTLSTVEVLAYDGTVLLSSHETDLPGSQHIDNEQLHEWRANEMGSSINDKTYGQGQLTAYRASRNYPLFIVTHIDRQQALAKWQRNTQQTLIVAGISLLTLLLLTSLLIARARRSLATETRMQEERQLAAQVFEHSTNGILIADPEARIVAVNPRFEAVSGYTADEVRGQNPRLFSSNQHDTAFYQAMWQTLNKTGLWSGHIVNCRKDGSMLEEWLTISAVRDGAGKLTHYVGVFEDISESRQRDSLIRRLSQAVEQSPTSIVITNLEPAIEYVNPQFFHTTGFQPEEVIGKNPRLLQSGLTPKATYEAMWQALSLGERWEGEFINQRKNGSIYHERAILAPIRDENAAITQYVAVKLDITEQRLQAIRLQRQLAALRALNDIVAITTMEPRETLRAALQVAVEHLHLEFGIVSHINRSAGAYRIEVQISPPQTLHDNQHIELGITYCSVTLKHEDVLAIANVEQSDLKAHPCFREFKLAAYIGAPIYVNGELYGTINFSSMTARDHDFDPSDLEFLRLLARWAGAFIERMRGLEQLVDARHAAEAASLAKSNFLANISHEIRTPMNGVIGMADLLLGSPLTAEQRDFAETIRHSADGLLGLINDLLDFSKIEAGKLELEHIPFSPAALLRDILALLTHQASSKNITLNADSGPGIPLELLGDPGRLRQILINLVGNALKFTPAGSVHIQMDCLTAPSTPAQIQLAFTIRDTGIGMSRATIADLFSPFYQADASTTRRFGGTGLGLSICKRLVELMGGEISAQSTPGSGSTFHFQLPFQLASANTTPAAADTRTDSQIRPGLRLLLVEDNLINQKVAGALLKKLGAEVRVAINGAEALNRLAEEAFDIILMDCQMPIMDGFEATRRVRAGDAGEIARRLPIIAMTANAMQGDRERCLAAGMNDYIAKPFSHTDLTEALLRWDSHPQQN
ncbi:MAG: PAS domain S-box protein [Azonexus sp.]|nr:PAS domain S-box protein [Azonexus sp.]MDZ4316201.1 PAS domain S-box protein [Azonexus sp.]